jgi:hypothetical protein
MPSVNLTGSEGQQSHKDTRERLFLITASGILLASTATTGWLWLRYSLSDNPPVTNEKVAEEGRAIQALTSRTEENERSIQALNSQLRSAKSLLDREYVLSRQDALNLSEATKKVETELPKKADVESINEVRNRLSQLQVDLDAAKTAQELDKHELKTLAVRNTEELAQLKSGGIEHHEFAIHSPGGETVVCGLTIRLKSFSQSSQQFSVQMRDSKSDWIQKTNVYRNEPIYWYLTGTSDVLEIVVTHVNPDGVVGLVNLPKNRASDACG